MPAHFYDPHYGRWPYAQAVDCSLPALATAHVSSAASSQWMRNYVASPIFRLRNTPRSMIVTYWALCAVWLAGVIVTGSFDSAGATGAIVGAIAGVVMAGTISKKRRQRDQARLDAGAGD